jgi:hypothetical protein
MKAPTPVIGGPDPHVLGTFYAKLLDWQVVENDADWVAIAAPDEAGGRALYSLSFQREPYWVRPVWPAVPGQQQMTMHLDIAVDNLEASIALALDLGASVAEFQPQKQNRVMLDPAGNPFCLGEDEG